MANQVMQGTSTSNFGADLQTPFQDYTSEYSFQTVDFDSCLHTLATTFSALRADFRPKQAKVYLCSYYRKSWGLRALFDTFFHGFEIYFRILTGANIPATRGTDRGFRENTDRQPIASSGSHLRTLISDSRMLGLGSHVQKVCVSDQD